MVALWYATFELPRQLHQVLLTFFPEYGILDSPPPEFVPYWRQIGTICLIIVVGTILLGFIARVSSVTLIGAFAFYVPVFGSFSWSMFSLAGIQILRVLWLPILERCPALMTTGELFLLPYIITDLIHKYGIVGQKLITPTSHREVGVISPRAKLITVHGVTRCSVDQRSNNSKARNRSATTTSASSPTAS